MSILSDTFSKQALAQSLNHPTLDRELETSLINRAQRGDADAMAALVEHNRKLIFTLAHKLWKSGACGDAEIVDVQQWGELGFMEGVRRFEIKRDAKLTTYAYYWVNAYLYRYAVKNGRWLALSYRTSARISALKKAQGQLAQVLMREATAEELSEYLGLDVEIVNTLINAARQAARFDDPVNAGTDSNLTLGDTLADDDQDTETAAMTNVQAKALMELVGELPERSQVVLSHVYELNGHEKLTREAVAQKLGLTKQRVFQIEKQALDWLKVRLLRGSHPEDFL